MKKKDVVAVSICAIMALSGLTACGNAGKVSAQDGTENVLGQKEMEDQELGGVQIPNPFMDCETLEEAEELAGFDLTVPDVWEEFNTKTIRVLQNEMIEVIYKKGEDGEEGARIRKALGEEDISGDYNVYAEEKIKEIGDASVTIKGDGEQFMLAVWTANGYTYSVRVAGLSEEKITELVQQVQ